jgi:hypothetical protein
MQERLCKGESKVVGVLHSVLAVEMYDQVLVTVP